MMQGKHNVKILDCTLRDGGYYNDWDFSREFVHDLVAALHTSGVDIIELGYKSTVTNEFFGLLRYCDEPLLRDILPKEGRAQYAFMIDAKEFLTPDGAIDSTAVDRHVLAAEKSIFSWARVATHVATINGAVELIKALKVKGYQTALNIMGVSLLSDEALASALRQLDPSAVDVLYFADSFGSLTPADSLSYLSKLRAGFAGNIGVHMHENQGLALANTLAALSQDVEFVDATVAGMGRGAGNLRLEQLLLTLYFRHDRKDLVPSALLPVLKKHSLPMQAHYGWGWDFSYMLSGLIGIHPTYCQELKTGSRYDIEDVTSILEAIPPGRRAKFDERELRLAESSVANGHRAMPQARQVNVPLPRHDHETVLICAGGPSLGRHVPGLKKLIERQQPWVLECNDTRLLAGVARTTIVMNSVRMAELISGPGSADPSRTVATGLEFVAGGGEAVNLRSVKYELRAGTFEVGGGAITLPSFVVGMLAVGVALQAKPKRIYLAGFDGFDDVDRSPEQREMESFWQLVKANLGASGVQIISLLPTSYDLPVQSVYSLL